MGTVLIVTLIMWHLIGLIICVAWSTKKDADGLEIYNPYWAYKYHESVNWFSAIMLSLLYTVLCPIGAVCYWFYKLCTIGRK